MSINTREDANKYYQMINELVDDYIDKYKIDLPEDCKLGSSSFCKYHTNVDALKNNLTLNDINKGLPVKSSKKLYAKIQLPTSMIVPLSNKCDNIPAVDISGIEDNDYANF